MQSQQISKCCLTIAGSDSGGNAGVQADLRAFHAYGLHGCTVFTALTAQNPFRVSAIHPVDAAFVGAQLDAVLGVYEIAAVKTGMLAEAAAIECVAEKLAAFPALATVVDPVMIATSGARLADASAMTAARERLFPRATLLTPNLPEAEFLAGVSGAGRAADVAWARELAARLNGAFGCAVLVKGGHRGGSAAVDVLYDGREYREFSAPWIAAPVSTHGTGCSLSSAIAAELALGRTLAEAVRGGKEYVHRAIADSYYVGADCGVLGFVSR